MSTTGEAINPACLNTEERIFVSYDCVKKWMQSTDNEDWREDHWGIYSVCLWDDLYPVPRQGARIRITWWHNGIPVKIELKRKTSWLVIYKLDELPAWTGLKCLKNCGGE